MAMASGLGASGSGTVSGCPSPSSRADGNTGGGRGWRILREHWRDFLEQRTRIPSRVGEDLARLDTSPKRGGLSREAADRALDRIAGQFNAESPRGAQNMKAWQRCKQMNAEVRAAMAEMGWRPPQGSSAIPAAELYLGGTAVKPSDLFPEGWWRVLGPEVLADLVVDAFMGEFCDSFLDSITSLVELEGGLGGLSRSTSEAAIPRPRALRALNRPFQSMPPAGDLELARPSRVASTSSLRRLPPGQPELWSTKQFHPCQQLEPFTRRIQKASELQRPRRRLQREEGHPLDPKFDLPMMATNFPKAWDQTTRKKVAGGSAAERRSSVSKPVVDKEEPENKDHLLSLGRDGKTTFPYSLALHRAFLESQPDPVLKEKARQLAPLRMTENW